MARRKLVRAAPASADKAHLVRRRLFSGGLLVILTAAALARPWQVWRRYRLDHASTAQLEAAVRKTPGDAYAWLALARNLEDRPRLPHTVDSLRTALVYCPDDPGVIARVAIVDLAEGHDAVAGNAIDRALVMAPGSWDAHYAAALAYERRGMLPAAIAQLQALVTVRPAEPCLWYHLGICQVDTNNYAPGEKALDRAVALDPAQAEYLAALGRALKFMGDDSRAEMAYRRALAFRPREAVLWRELGTLYAEWKTGARAAEGIAALRRALAIDPNLSGAYESLGTLYENQRSWHAALDAWKAASRLRPDEESARVHLITVYRQLGDSDRAQQEEREEQTIAEQNAITEGVKARAAANPGQPASPLQ